MISKTYAPQEIEEKWYQYWLDNQFFKSTPDEREPYTIVIPPPNVTGVLHMGHMLNNTIQDVLIRKARMEGKNACWVPGTDHASIATEAKVVAMLKERGINKTDLTRDEFLEYAWEWTHKYGGIILKQLRKLGASCDWDRTRFTMEPALYDSVIDVFVDLYNKGQIYRGIRMVNWDPQGRTAVSDEEVITKEIQQKLVYIRYDIAGSEGQDSITIATVRPETIMADVAIAVNPDDERYKHLHGKKAIIPLINREIPIIADDYVTTDFGTGGLKVTPAHDPNDYALGVKHNLPVIDILNDDGTLNEKAQILVGVDRFAARKAIIKLLEESGNLVKTEDYKSNVGTSERTNAVIEPRLSMQWFLKMDELSKPAFKNVMDDTIQLVPPKFKNMYRAWMENVHDWCISRQLWWGQRIPAFYMQDGTVIVAKNKHEALEKVQHEKLLFAMTEADLTQDEDVLDTWFSSWLWPITVFDGLKDPNNADINYYYPTNDLVTAPEILFFWVARMIIAGYEYRGKEPFKNVYLTGIVRDKLGRKMSKQLGNSPDPLDLIDQYGADGVRTGMLFSSAAGNDLMFDEKLVEQGRNFSNKIWNAFRLVKGWTIDNGNEGTIHTLSPSHPNVLPIQWFESKLNATLIQIEDDFSKFRISDALQAVYKLIWDDFCSQYLELIKPGFEQPIDRVTYEATINFFERLMCLAHPFMPFITEEIWQDIRERETGTSICVASFPKAGAVDQQILADFDILFEVVSNVRNIRNAKQISPKVALPLAIKTVSADRFKPLEPLISKIANVAEVSYVDEKTQGIAFLIKSDEFFVNVAGEIDLDQEIANTRKELDYNIGFRDSILKKLSNEKFVANAKPEVVDRERQKLADAEAKIQALEQRMQSLK
ncbi:MULTISPECIES: valine--tRNA ligase [unclassified Spirosoma]|uniref:valine--tRNA ligase n=1 Tax=unclassified Spirosoma TaxID=2621999 RepID=UPI000963832C|nr:MULTISPECIES: valine--tRNA ligase [unclassified Spirosoma]MBN8825078.1 valine--tRNA ligase [Spirosoma sp.]OJW73365.1 MAG: valine--tRNA ligase [Spirosoma sp. 48-14]